MEARPVRPGVTALVGFALFALHAPDARASCAAPPTPFGHLLGSYFTCADSRPVAAYAWQISDPAGVNSDGLDLVCEAASTATGCLTGGAAGDEAVTIESDWANAGFIGCPVNTGSSGTGDRVPHRIAVITLPA